LQSLFVRINVNKISEKNRYKDGQFRGRGYQVEVQEEPQDKGDGVPQLQGDAHAVVLGDDDDVVGAQCGLEL
jgi:hypothetical protein